MDFTEFALRTTLLATPGAVSCKILEAMTGRRYTDLWRAGIDALLFSMLSYLALALILARGAFHSQASLAFLTSAAPIEWAVVGWATLLAILIASLWTGLSRHRWLYEVGLRLRLTSRISDDDVWSEFLDPQKHKHWKKDWYFVRDHSKTLLYYGAITSWSDSRETRELVLENVSVCDGRTGREMFKTDVLYLAADVHSLTIEAPSEQNHQA